MANYIENILGRKVNGVRVVPLLFKIVVLFTIFLLLSNFSSNYINLMLNRGELIKLMNQLLVKDLKESYVFAMNQHDIYSFNQDLPGAVSAIEQSASKELKGNKSLLLGVKANGDIFVMASKLPKAKTFTDKKVLDSISEAKKKNVFEGTINFDFLDSTYFGIYKYNPKWDVYLIRAEENDEFYQDSRRIFRNIAAVILIITIVCVVVGVFPPPFHSPVREPLHPRHHEDAGDAKNRAPRHESGAQRRRHLSRGRLQQPLQHHRQPAHHIQEIRGP